MLKKRIASILLNKRIVKQKKPGAAGFSLLPRASVRTRMSRSYYCFAAGLLDVALVDAAGAVLVFFWCFLALVVAAGLDELV
jgi:hypothetical protein